MQDEVLEQAIEFLEKANADLEPELLSGAQARGKLALYAKAERLVAFGFAALSRRVDDAATVAKATGTSMGKAKAVVATGKVMADSGELTTALQHGRISLDQAAVIASAEDSAPGAAADLVKVAREQNFHALRDEARRVKLEAEQHRDLAGRQRRARSARTYTDELGMGHIHLCLEPHRYALVSARAEAEAARLATADKRHQKQAGSDEGPEPFERYLADAYATMLSSNGAAKGRATRPETVVLVSHPVAKRGWTHVEPGEICKIPGIGPISPQVARQIATDAFLTGVLYDGKDLRQMTRWSRSIPVEVGLALELGDPPEFDGVKCVDCGNRFRTEFDHVEPHVALGPCSTANLKPRCWSCHTAKTERDRRAGKLRAPPRAGP
jgi:5-methylcytosine-specific restriction endonuclease McrA